MVADPVGEARRHRTDPGNGHEAERNAGDEHVEAAGACAQFAQREAQRQPAGRSGELGEGDSAQAAVLDAAGEAGGCFANHSTSYSHTPGAKKVASIWRPAS